MNACLTPSPPVAMPYAWARKGAAGVVVYRDEACTLLLASWPFYRAGCPDKRQRYLHVERVCYRLRWKTL